MASTRRVSLSSLSRCQTVAMYAVLIVGFCNVLLLWQLWQTLGEAARGTRAAEEAYSAISFGVRLVMELCYLLDSPPFFVGPLDFDFIANFIALEFFDHFFIQ